MCDAFAPRVAVFYLVSLAPPFSLAAVEDHSRFWIIALNGRLWDTVYPRYVYKGKAVSSRYNYNKRIRSLTSTLERQSLPAAVFGHQHTTSTKITPRRLFCSRLGRSLELIPRMCSKAWGTPRWLLRVWARCEFLLWVCSCVHPKACYCCTSAIHFRPFLRKRSHPSSATR